MLKGIHPLLSADLLHAMASMGHGDELAIVDANFPAISVGRRVVTIHGADSTALLDAVLTVFPVDTFVSPAVFTMQVVGDAAAVPEPVAEFARTLRAHGLTEHKFEALERHAFYARARNAFVVARTGELRPYGNVLLVKGVVNG
jgi:L-fucose mutarotase